MKLLIITYHYFGEEKPGQRGAYPMSADRFARQLDAIAHAGWTFISEWDLILSFTGAPLPEKACLITFDDGLRSQYTVAAPILLERNIGAVFFASTRHLEARVAYLVHKIHYLLSMMPPAELLSEFEKAYQETVGAPLDWSASERALASGHYQYDDAETARFKLAANHVLDSGIAEAVVGALFARVHGDEAAFSESLYLSQDDMKRVLGHKLFSFGVHTHSHRNAAQEGAEALCRDMKKNYSVLRDQVGATPYGIAYPFGSITPALYEQKLKQGVSELGLSYGLTTERKMNENFETPFLLGRFTAEDITHGKRPIIAL